MIQQLFLFDILLNRGSDEVFDLVSQESGDDEIMVDDKDDGEDRGPGVRVPQEELHEDDVGVNVIDVETRVDDDLLARSGQREEKFMYLFNLRSGQRRPQRAQAAFA